MENIKLWQGDCLELMNNIPDKSVDMILCDLPYGMTQCKWDIVIPFEPLWEQYKRIIKDNGAIVLFGCQPFTSKLISSNYKMFRYEWIYHKSMSTGFLNAKKMPLRTHENICVFYKKLPTYNPQFTSGTAYKKRRTIRSSSVYNKKDLYSNENNGFRYPVSVIRFANSNQKDKLHPTEKPVNLLEYFIKTYSNENEIVLDNCMGAGSTGIACLNTNRKFIGIEKDKDFYNIACERIKNHK